MNIVSVLKNIIDYIKSRLNDVSIFYNHFSKNHFSKWLGGEAHREIYGK